MFGFLVPGVKEVLLVALVALALYGRSGTRVLRSTRYGRAVSPWLDLVRVPDRGRPAPPKPKPRGRWFWALALTAAAAVAAWVATRLIILSGSGLPH